MPLSERHAMRGVCYARDLLSVLPLRANPIAGWSLSSRRRPAGRSTVADCRSSSHGAPESRRRMAAARSRVPRGTAWALRKFAPRRTNVQRGFRACRATRAFVHAYPGPLFRRRRRTTAPARAAHFPCHSGLSVSPAVAGSPRTRLTRTHALPSTSAPLQRHTPTAALPSHSDANGGSTTSAVAALPGK